MSKKFNLHTDKLKTLGFESSIKTKPSTHSNKGNLLLQLMHEMAKAKSKQRLFSLVVDYSLRVFDIVNAGVYFPDEKSQKLVALYSRSNSDLEPKLRDLRLAREIPLNSDYPLVRAFKNRRVVTATNEVPSSLRKIGIKSCTFFPIVFKDEAQGVLVLRANKHFNFSDEDIRIGELLALHLGLKIHNRELDDSNRHQKETLELLQNSVKEGLALHGPDGVIYYANKAIGQFFGNTSSTLGLKREELLKNWNKYHKFRVSHLYDVVLMRKAVYEEKKPFLNGLIMIHSTPPKIIEANYYPVVKDGNFAGMAAAYRDVTKEKRQENELEQNLKKIQKERDRWQTVFSNVDEGVCLVDRRFNITHLNSACENFLGLDLDKVIGKSYYQVFKCHTPGGLYYPDFNPLEKVLITKEPISYEEHLHVSSTGEESWVGVSASPIKDYNDEIQEIVIVIREINAFKEVEKAKSQFVSIASHELRTPLTVINGYLSLLINGDLGDFADSESRERLKVILGKVYSETTRLTDLVSNLLNVSRIEEKRIQLNRKESPIKEVIDEVVGDLRYVADQKQINLKIETNGKAGPLKAYFDKGKIHEVLVNLADNAIKFSDNGSSVVVKYWQEDGRVFVSVKDTGIGIPKKLQSIIFEKFQQVPGSYLKENRGTGLGLYIVKSLIELHEGSLEVDSEPGKGSLFTFSLPTDIA